MQYSSEHHIKIFIIRALFSVSITAAEEFEY